MSSERRKYLACVKAKNLAIPDMLPYMGELPYESANADSAMANADTTMANADSTMANADTAMASAEASGQDFEEETLIEDEDMPQHVYEEVFLQSGEEGGESAGVRGARAERAARNRGVNAAEIFMEAVPAGSMPRLNPRHRSNARPAPLTAPLTAYEIEREQNIERNRQVLAARMAAFRAVAFGGAEATPSSAKNSALPPSSSDAPTPISDTVNLVRAFTEPARSGSTATQRPREIPLPTIVAQDTARLQGNAAAAAFGPGRTCLIAPWLFESLCVYMKADFVPGKQLSIEVGKCVLDVMPSEDCNEERWRLVVIAMHEIEEEVDGVRLGTGKYAFVSTRTQRIMINDTWL
ncbi:hypothetical protein CYMTET_40622 [Cymbomonas tetramitiformis]|uniref:Uncharacterized protein n=1 Tax=Cymbomonas tetramitiformis TaxID=36881 RepID=A0AAE0F2T2_9CHLO|nr:hypothetical protein CYMTET_40622 [Cymbomonas tetramitiformis]